MGSCLSSESRNPLPGTPTTPSGGRKKKGLRKRLGSRNSSFDYRREEQLHRIPGRMFVNGSSEVASLFTQQGKKGTNQDAMIVWEKFGSRTDTIFCGVFDGHGPYGHMVAKRVRDSLPLKLSANWEVKIKNSDAPDLNSMRRMNSEATSLISMDEVPKVLTDLEEKYGEPQLFQTLKESFLKAFKVMDRELKVYGNIDCFCSGTTAVTLVKQGQDLVIGNVGDSRAVLGTRDDDDQLVPVQLTVDLKPNLPGELERIHKCKGRVFSLKDEPEVARVWLPNNDSPGLAMARAFGDFCLKDFGLISVPDISYRRLTEKDEFIVLATDGIWDVLSNEEVVKIVASSPTRASASRKLVESAVRGWKMKYPTSKVDDCAVVCLFLDADSNVSTASVVGSSEMNTTTGEKEVGNGDENLGSSPSRLSHAGTVVNGKEGSGQGRQEVDSGDSKEEASEYEDANTELGIEWSALEGVSRVNTMLTLPRFVPENEKKGAGNKKM
ncbi:protein phosphatase [Lithospermum erythrorhizon]|uniref:protein-serine/threonine phosphatase n=1 Tax=Lithospermum erythrorhizon TaxID=34254 RepID=A0AAV3S1D4_LITER